MKPILPGMSATAHRTVAAEHLADAVGSGSLPVLATPVMAALMEEAACRVLAPFLEDGETTVGTSLHIEHTAATAPGMTVIAEAQLLEVNGREITLRVTARDEAGPIGEGTHKRFVVLSERFVQKAQERGGHV
ncbi:MAG: thioesterase family protein [Oscillospiraceae bacterium]|nr:thioesterase family protein [Oscillospiraceae bacterium]